MTQRTWKAWSPEAATEEDQQQKSERSTLPYIKLKEGRNVVRILPPSAEADSPFLRVWQHYIDGDDGKLIVFECPFRGKPPKLRMPCPACDHGTRLDTSVNPLDREKARKFFPTLRVYANAIDRSDALAGPKVLTMPSSVYEELLGIAKDSDAGGDFTDPQGGFDVVITRTGSGKETRYKAKAARENSPLADDPADADEWLESLHNLRDSVRVLTVEQIREAMALENEAPQRRLAPPAQRPAATPRASSARGRAIDDAVDVDAG